VLPQHPAQPSSSSSGRTLVFSMADLHLVHPEIASS
jgi:hypothetical protein